jgi:N-acetylneuraminic acid mutarotase
MMKWLRPAVNGESPCARSAHTTELCGKLFVYGGWDGSQMLGDLYVIHPDSMTWSKPIPTGPEPRTRAGHSCTAVGTKLYVWGGGDGADYLNDLNVLETETMSWCRAFSTGTPPTPRSRHSATLVNENQIWIFGGGGDTNVYNDIYILHTDTMEWHRPVVKGTPPSVRWGHTATLVEAKIYIFGGHDGKNMLNDLSFFDVNNMRWEKVKSIGDFPPPLAGHTATPLKINGKNFILYFGGGDGNEIYKDAYLLDLQNFQWTKPVMGGLLPAARCAHSANLIGDKLLVFGGGDRTRRFKDIYLLDLRDLLEGNIEKQRDMRQHPVTPTRFSAGRKPNNNKFRSNRYGYPPPPPPPTNQSNPITPSPVPPPPPAITTSPPIRSREASISSWLSSIGMGMWTDHFIKQELDLDVLPFLTEKHLMDMGVNTLGARLRLLAHIKNLTQSGEISVPNTKKLAASHTDDEHISPSPSPR